MEKVPVNLLALLILDKTQRLLHRPVSCGIAAWGDAKVFRRARFLWLTALPFQHRSQEDFLRFAAPAAASFRSNRTVSTRQPRLQASARDRDTRYCRAVCGTGCRQRDPQRCTFRGLHSLKHALWLCSRFAGLLVKD